MPTSKKRKKKPAKVRTQRVWIDEPLPEDSFDPELAATLSARGWVQEDGPGNEYWTYTASSEMPGDPDGDNPELTSIMLDLRNRDPYIVAPPSHDSREAPYERKYDDRAGILADLDEIESWRAPDGNRSETAWELAELRRIGTLTTAQLIRSLSTFPYLPSGHAVVENGRHIGDGTVRDLCMAEDDGILTSDEVSEVLDKAFRGFEGKEHHAGHGAPRMASRLT
ncbi:hypothetical protein [Paenarthrobacter sp. YJN-5]|uniref:hypothetical protein n=1 Tax=Paenarthrobacter sp. YJN-5 TaxID=2735316 RepID=UPI001877C112|nr:hypothetical protein [Paenarthrobacter sp. YJN-5]QOT19393.1 hypothetical protein HMI59_22330 [Paenarthrobacter sp. YJN-5]